MDNYEKQMTVAHLMEEANGKGVFAAATGISARNLATVLNHDDVMTVSRLLSVFAWKRSSDRNVKLPSGTVLMVSSLSMVWKKDIDALKNIIPTDGRLVDLDMHFGIAPVHPSQPEVMPVPTGKAATSLSRMLLETELGKATEDQLLAALRSRGLVACTVSREDARAVVAERLGDVLDENEVESMTSSLLESTDSNMRRQSTDMLHANLEALLSTDPSLSDGDLPTP